MTASPFFTIIVTTCRPDYPLRYDKEKHVLDMIVESCLKQRFKDFELIIVDLCWQWRKEWFEDNFGDVGFPVLHVPDKSSIFRDLRLIRICAARNTGLLYARGKCVIFSDDGQDWSANALSALHPWGSKNRGATCRLHRDKGRGPVEMDSRWQAFGIQGTMKTKVVGAQHIGYLGGTLSMVPLEFMLECNGWDEMFDGSRQLEDADMARRLGAAGLQMALEGHPKVIEYEMAPCTEKILRRKPMAKCNGSYCYPIWDEQPDRVRANDRILTDAELDTFVGGSCPRLDNAGYCMVSKDQCQQEWHRRALMNIYKDERLVFDLRKLRAQRSWETVSQDPLLVM